MISKTLRASARGQECTLQIAGACNGDTATTILAHLPDESGGMGRKSDDISACYACSSCHDVIDGRVNWPLSDADREWYMRRAQTRTWRRAIDLGLVSIRGLKL